MKRPDNLQLVKALSLKIESFSAVSPAVFTRYVMVDSQPGHSPLTEALAFQVIIDHHPLTVLSDNPEKRPVYIDIRPEIGATASLLAGYLKAAQIKPNFRLATALFYAIKTDTHNFVRQVQSLDMRAFRWLYSYINLDLLANIEKAPVARSSFKKLLAGLNGAVFYKNRVYTFLGRTDHADTLVLTADFLMKVSGVSQSLAAGICGRKLVIIFRAEGIRQDVGKLAQEAFGKFGSAGGHKNMARAEIYLENLDNKIRNNPVAIGRFVLRRLAGE
jgi:nanoRNase/pAp phosphatase (c-di-AMP/oligoRNAs hydrolase)